MSAFDVFPRRNLPPEAEEWGRKVESRIFQAENTSASSGQSLAGLNRSSASTLGELAQQINRVQDLYEMIPKANQQTQTVNDFGVTSSGTWNTLATVTFSALGAGTLSVTAVASGQLRSPSTSTNMEVSYRLSASGSSTGPTIPGLYATPSGQWVNNFMTTWGWDIPMAAGSSVTLSLQANPIDGASWPSGSGSYVVLSAFSTFSKM